MKNILIITFIFAIFSCGKKEDPAPVIIPLSTKIKKVWTPETVKEAGTLVYTKGATGNTKAGYLQFKLDLSSATAVTLTELDGNSFTGTWELQNDTKLVLKNLNPVPTTTTGTIEFTVNSASETILNISRISQNPKSGNTLNDYLLK
jgi:hypothetical protein